MKAGIGIIAIGLLAALFARRFVTSLSGLTFTMPSATIYVSYNIIVFWVLIALSIVLGVLRLVLR